MTGTHAVRRLPLAVGVLVFSTLAGQEVVQVPLNGGIGAPPVALVHPDGTIAPPGEDLLRAAPGFCRTDPGFLSAACSGVATRSAPQGFCGPDLGFASAAVPSAAAGDVEIMSALSAGLPDPCGNTAPPSRLMRNAGDDPFGK